MVNSGSQKMSTRRGLTLIELAIVLAILIVLILLLLPTSSSSYPGPRAVCLNNLKQISLALEEYNEVHGMFPPAYTLDAEGKRLHSWRTLILPYLDQVPLYESIDLGKPWHDPVNTEALNRIPKVYICPANTNTGTRTLYLGVGGSGGCFAGSKPRKREEITDKPEETLMVIEVHSDRGVPWMAPIDADETLILDVDPKSKWPHPQSQSRCAAFVDTRVRALVASETTVADLKRMMTIAGGD